MPFLPTLGQKPWQAIMDAFLLVGHNADGTNKADANKADVASAVMDGDAAGGALAGTFPNPGLAAAVAGAGLGVAANVLSVNVDGTTLEVVADTVQVKNGGITAAKVAADVATQAELDAHTGQAAGAHAATAISSTATGQIAATTVQAAIIELEAEKQAVSAKGVANGYASLDASALVPDAQIPATITRDTELSVYQLTSAKGAISGYASLDGAGTVPDAQIPAAITRDSEMTTALGSYQLTSAKGAVNGYASLDGTGKVPAAQLPVVPAGANGTLALRPAAAAGNAGTFYYASDQDVLYFSTGAAWLRIGLPPGATTTLYSNTVPTGWIAYDGTALPASTGIYADLYAHLGNTTATPDTRGRILVHKGSHADVDVLGDNDGTALANRTPKHNSTLTGTPAVGTLSVNSHTHALVAAGVSGAPGVGTLAVGSHTHNLVAATVTGTPALGTLVVSGAPGLGTLAVSGAPAVGTLAVNSHSHGLVAATVTGAPALSGAVSHNLSIYITAGTGWSMTANNAVAFAGAGSGGQYMCQSYEHANLVGASVDGAIWQNPSYALSGGVNNGSLGVGVGTLDVGGTTDGATATIGGAPGIGTLAVGGAPAIGTLAVGGAPGVGSLDVGGNTDGATATVTGAPDVGTLDVSGSTDGATATIAGSPAIGTLASGPGGTLPVDTPAFITFSVVIAKL
jgi:hypothetical protein